MNKVNVNGGVIVIGYLIGCLGVRIFIIFLYEMKRRDVKIGFVIFCIGGGMGIILIVKR